MPLILNTHLYYTLPHTLLYSFLQILDTINPADVQWILDSVVQELAADPSKRFIYVEVAFFSRWFDEQNGATRRLVKKLVNEGKHYFQVVLVKNAIH